MKYRAQRHPTRFPVTLIKHGIKERCTVFSISASGARVTTDGSMCVNDKIALDFPGGKISAVVRWAEDDKIGVMFTRPLPLAVLNKIRFSLRGSSHQPRASAQFSELR